MIGFMRQTQPPPLRFNLAQFKMLVLLPVRLSERCLYHSRPLPLNNMKEYEKKLHFSLLFPALHLIILPPSFYFWFLFLSSSSCFITLSLSLMLLIFYLYSHVSFHPSPGLTPIITPSLSLPLSPYSASMSLSLSLPVSRFLYPT